MQTTANNAPLLVQVPGTVDRFLNLTPMIKNIMEVEQGFDPEKIGEILTQLGDEFDGSILVLLQYIDIEDIAPMKFKNLFFHLGRIGQILKSLKVVQIEK